MPRTLPGRAVRWAPAGVSDAQDASNGPQGGMAALINLIPSPKTPKAFVPRSASSSLTTFTGFTDPGAVTALLQVGNIVYGMIGETGGANAGLDIPFAYNLSTQTFETISNPLGVTAYPTSPAGTGDWTPPCMQQVGQSIIITHPGFAGAGQYFGWLDISGFTSNTITGSTHTNKTIDTLSASAILAGWQVGDKISSSAGDIPANTIITGIASNGLSITISNAATGSNAGDTLTVTGGTATAPLYGSGDTGSHSLGAIPNCVFQFNGRAYFGMPSGFINFSDSLLQRQITGATQSLAPSNGIAVTAMGGLGFYQTLGGVLQALVCFQGSSAMLQVTGDAASNSSPLALNNLGIGIGTPAPNTVAPTSRGLGFISGDGYRILQFNGQITDPIGSDGEGVCFPFLAAVAPTRMCAAYNQNVYRVSVQNGAVNGQPVQEYWYDFKLKVWSGPHTFPAALIVPSQLTSANGFTLVASGIAAELWFHSAVPTINDTFTENSVALTFTSMTSLLPDGQEVNAIKVVAATLAAQIAANSNIVVAALNEAGSVLEQVELSGPTLSNTVWDNFVWGGALWGGPGSYFYRHPLNWPQAIVAKQFSLQVTGQSALGTVLGSFDFQVEDLGYVTQAYG